MRVLENNFGWNPIETAPLDEDVTLEVADGRGGPYRLPTQKLDTKKTCGINERFVAPGGQPAHGNYGHYGVGRGFGCVA
jgi:hypothetical protein